MYAIRSYYDTIVFLAEDYSSDIKISATGCSLEEWEYEINRTVSTNLNDIIVQDYNYCVPNNSYQRLEITNYPSTGIMDWTVIEGDLTFDTPTFTTKPWATFGTNQVVVSVSSQACPSVTVIDTINIQPLAPSIITGSSCINTQIDTNSYSVSSVANANSYEWNYPDSWMVLYEDSTSNLITFETDGIGGVVEVKAVGCSESNWTNLEIGALPLPVEVIDSIPTYINANKSTTFNLSVEPVNGQTFSWEMPVV